MRSQTLRYVVVSGIGWAVDFAAFCLLYQVTGIVVAQLVARLVGAWAGFALHRRITFRAATSGLTWRQGARYSLLWLINYAVSTLGLLGAVAALPIRPELAKFAVEVLIAACNFLFMKLFVFREHHAN